MGNGKVLLDWVTDLSWKQQSTLISALRGPDTASRHVKKISRWMRMVCQNNADPTSDYMQQFEFPPVKELEDELMFCSTHYTLHFLYGLEIIGYHHADDAIAEKARELYEGVVYAFRLKPETKDELDERLKDRQ